MKIPNVGLIIRDHRESWDGEEITNLVRSMPKDNAYEEFSDPTSDMYALISGPESFIKKLYEDVESGENWTWNSGVYPWGTWLIDYGWWDADGLYWDGNTLLIVKGDKEYTMKEWEEVVDYE